MCEYHTFMVSQKNPTSDKSFKNERNDIHKKLLCDSDIKSAKLVHLTQISSSQMNEFITLPLIFICKSISLVVQI